jgi:hypothetical protein
VVAAAGGPNIQHLEGVGECSCYALPLNCMQSFFVGVWSIVKWACVIIVLVLVVGEGGSLGTVLFNDLIGRSYSIEFTDFPCRVYYLYRDSWFSPTHKFLMIPEVPEGEEETGDDAKQWVRKEVTGSKLGESDPFTDGLGATFIIRPQGHSSREDD